MSWWARYLTVPIALAIIECSGPAVVSDRSSDAFSSGDLTLISSCQSSPGPNISLASGVDSCRFTVGDRVDGAWTLILPPPVKGIFVTGGILDVYFKDVHRSYPIKNWVTQVQFSDLLGLNTWTSDFDEGVVEALATINWRDPQGLDQVVRYRAIAVLIVTSRGYDRLPADSGNSQWGARCRVELSTAGRSVVNCK